MKKIINIAILDFTLRGGIERFVANISELFSDQGHEIVLYSMHKTHEFPIYKLPPNIKIFYLTKFKFRSFFYKFTTFFACFKLIYHTRKEKSSVILVTSPIISVYLFIIKRSFLKRVIASEHSTYSSHSQLIQRLRVMAYRHVARVITQTVDGVRQFSMRGISALQIPNSTTLFNDVRQWTMQSRADEGVFRCLTVARFEQVKQLDHFIEVARIVNSVYPKVSFTIVGSGPEESSMRKLIADYKLERVVAIEGPTPAVNSFYAQSALYIITSSSESFSMTALEALSFGVPVVSYDELVGPLEIIENGKNGILVSQNRPDDIARQIIALYLDSIAHKRMQRNALKSSKRYSPSEVYKLWDPII